MSMPSPTTRRGRCIIGLMSGTSCDGVDAAVVTVRGRGLRMRVRLLGQIHAPYPPRLRKRLLAVMAPAETTTQTLCALHAAVGEHFGRTAAQAARDVLGRTGQADLIGSHGQTICHLPPRGSRTQSTVGSTLQIGDPARIAARTGVATVADFRQADIAAGGQGAPLVPWTDFVLLRSAARARAVQNIGGIANVTYLPAGATPDDVIAFDSGPGNLVIDGFVQHFSRGRSAYDQDGRRAARGCVIDGVLRRWMRHPFLRRRPPKTSGREAFGRAFVAQALAQAPAARPEDWLATATAFTARSIAAAYRRFLPARVDELIVTGGGAKNATLMRMLGEELPGVRVCAIDEFGIPESAKEAVSFAMLAAACVDRVPANLPRVTGARYAAILGSVTPAC